jgi:VWFA-related protein
MPTVLSLLLLGAGSAAPRATSGQAPATPVFEAQVALVAAPVFVTDKNGKAYRGLAAEDFEVYDGGQLVPVVAFQAVDVDEEAAPATPGPSALPVAVQAAAARQFVLVFDLQFSSPAGINRARTAGKRFVRESLAADDLVAVATFGREGLKLLTGMTTDRDYAARAIDGLGVVRTLEPSSDPLGLGGDLETPAGGSAMAEVADQEIAAQMAVLREDLRRQYQYRVSDLVASLDDLAQALSSLRGRKQVVLLSGGFAQEGWTDSSARTSPMGAFEQSRRDQLGAYAVRDRMSRLYRSAGVSDVVVHTIDLRGIEGDTDVSSPSGRDAGRGEGQLALAALADNTGGVRIRATNDFGAALREMDAVSRHYYVLAFQPADPAPPAGRARDLKVRVKRNGLLVSHRAAYAIPKPSPAADASAVRLAAAEAIAKGLSGGRVGLQLVALPYRDGKGRDAVPAVLYLDGNALAAAARDGQLPIQVYGYALAQGRVLDHLTLETTLDVSKAGATLRRDGFSVLATFAAAPGAVDLRFFVRAGAAGDTGSIRRQVEMPAFAGGETVLSAAIPTLSATGRIVAPTQTQGRPPLEIPFRVGGEPFLPGASPGMAPGLRSTLCVFGWPARPAAEALLEVTGEMTRPGQAPLPVRVEGTAKRVADPDGFDRYMVSVAPPPTAAGDYVLRLTFREPASGWSAVSETTIALGE